MAKMYVAGGFRMTGVSKAGSPYDFGRLVALMPQEQAQNDRLTRSGLGMQAVEMSVDLACWPKLTGLKYPGQYEVVTEARPGRQGVELYVVDVHGN